MKIVIVEDEVLVLEHLTDILHKNNYEVVAEADNISDALSAISLKPDLYLLDIRIAQGQNGIDIGERLNKEKVPFIYITANNEIEVIKKAIATEPITYITKPFNERDVFAALELVKLKISNAKTLKILTKKGVEYLYENDILFCKADGVYTDIHTDSQVITQRMKLKEIEAKLSDDFVRVHRSYVINKHKIDAKKASKVIISDTEIPISRTNKASFNKFLEG